ncbi:MAG: pyridoxal kinase PdxY [Planctomycetota bacterium]|jgi:pyridoxine kinase|nr:pyridoxal kinase PdxY [Planctomycetota bacterium]
MKNILSIQSHVVYGHAGNAAAVFPMRRAGVNVWPLNAVQFSNHTQYPRGWTGRVAGSGELVDLAKGIDSLGVLPRCDAVLSGYIGSAEQGESVREIVTLVKRANPAAWYFCDPVMGHPVKGCKVAPGVAEYHRDHSVAAADMMSPNVLELGVLVGRELENSDQCLAAARELLGRGPRLILVKHLSYAAKDRGSFEMMLVTPDQAWHTARPLVEFERQPVGVGDVVSGLTLASLLKGMQPKAALEFVTAAVYELILETFKSGEFELQLVAAQDRMASPGSRFAATAL